MMAETFDTCEFCDSQVEQRTIRARFHYKGQTIYIDNVPAWVCAKCGEQYFDAPVYKKLEEISRDASRIHERICFPLAHYELIPA